MQRQQDSCGRLKRKNRDSRLDNMQRQQIQLELKQDNASLTYEPGIARPSSFKQLYPKWARVQNLAITKTNQVSGKSFSCHRPYEHVGLDDLVLSTE